MAAFHISLAVKNIFKPVDLARKVTFGASLLGEQAKIKGGICLLLPYIGYTLTANKQFKTAENGNHKIIITDNSMYSMNTHEFSVT